MMIKELNNSCLAPNWNYNVVSDPLDVAKMREASPDLSP